MSEEDIRKEEQLIKTAIAVIRTCRMAIETRDMADGIASEMATRIDVIELANRISHSVSLTVEVAVGTVRWMTFISMPNLSTIVEKTMNSEDRTDIGSIEQWAKKSVESAEEAINIAKETTVPGIGNLTARLALSTMKTKKLATKIASLLNV